MAAAPDERLAPALETLGDLLAAPSAVAPDRVAAACATIALWAEARGAASTALAFAQNAALANPTEAEPALAVARLAVVLDDHARAELWYRRATGIARRARNWRLYARSFSGLGTLYQDRGNLPAAHRFHLRALRGARRGGLRLERAVALHDLFGLSVEAGRAREAERYAREAFTAYSPRSGRLTALAHDIAYFWMEEGRFAQALAVFQAVAPLVQRERERLWVDADLMRAAAGAGDRALARRMAASVREQCARPELADAAGRAHLELARGELQLDELEAAEASAAEALRLARAHREGRVALMAESLLQAIRVENRVNRASSRDRTDTDLADDALAAELIRSLRGLSPLDAAERRSADSTETTVNTLLEPEARPH